MPMEQPGISDAATPPSNLEADIVIVRLGPVALYASEREKPA
jgi:hypothetical protein